MGLETTYFEIRKCGGSFIDGRGAVEADAELVLTLAGRDVLVSRGIDIGIDADRDRSHQTSPARNIINHLQFLLRLDIEAVNPLTQSVVDLSGRLADTRKSTAISATSSLENLEEFATRDDVESRPFLGKQV